MSIHHMSLVMNHYAGPSHLKLTLLILADHAGDNGECYPSYETLAARLCCNERTAMRNVKQLMEAGYVEYAMRGGRVYDKASDRWVNASNVFRVVEARLVCLPNLKEQAKARKKLSTANGGNSATDVTPRGVAHVTPPKHDGGDAGVTLIINRNIINNHHAKKAVENSLSTLSDRWRVANE